MGTVQQPLRIPLSSINPQLDNDVPNYIPGSPATYLILSLCYDTLAGPSVRPDRDGIISPDFLEMKPRLVESFGENPDSTWWIRLKKGILSHWGNELTAESIKWGFQKAFAVNNTGCWRWGQIAGLENAESVEILDKYTLRYTLRSPNPHFPAYLFFATPSIVDATEVSRHASDQDPWAMEWLAQNVAGFGAYALTDLNDDRMVLKSRKEYWAGESPVPNIVVERTESRTQALKLLSGPDPVFLAGVRCDEIREIEGNSGVRLTGTWAGHASVEINYHTPPFDDIRVRHALSFATPYNEVIKDGFLGLARPWKSPIKTFTAWYTDKAWTYDTDVARAKKLLSEAGYADGFETTLYVPQRPEMLRTAAILQRAYGRIGVKIEIENLDTTPKGWMPPLHLRTECAHNLTEPLYDLAHDYAPFDPILPAPGGPVGVGTWLPRYAGDRNLEDMYRDTLLAPTKQSRKERCVALLNSIVEFAPCIFLAETPLFNASNDKAHPWTSDYNNRLVQQTLFQNSNSRYLSP
jgi:peptide/nickel transport system substrate-binding protein